MRFLLLISSLLVLCGCNVITGGSDEPIACTMEFRMFDVVLADEAGAPVAGADVDVARAATGRSIVCPAGTEAGNCVRPGQGQEKGRYLVMQDGIEVRRGGEAFDVRAAKGDAVAEARFTFSSDLCHVSKVSGPDTLRLAR